MSQDNDDDGLHGPIAAFAPQARYRLLLDAIEAIRDYAIFMLEPDGRVATWNAGAQRIKGYAADDIIGRHFSVFYTPADRATGKPARALARAAAQGRFEDEGWRLRSDGTRFWANVTITAVRDVAGTLRGYLKVTRDMTERERLNELQHADEVALRIQHARESEQKRIARELHDDLGQQLSAMKMEVSRLATGLADPAGDPAQGLAHTRSLQQQIDSMMDALRRIAADLRPPMLDDLGLEAALEGLADAYRSRYGLDIRAHFDTHGLIFEPGAATAIFRMVQEALTNVVRHAQATRVSLRMTLDGAACRIHIDDNGRGAASQAQRASGTLGLVGMRERARQLNGMLRVDSLPGHGFHIEIELPLAHLVGDSAR